MNNSGYIYIIMDSFSDSRIRQLDAKMGKIPCRQKFLAYYLHRGEHNSYRQFNQVKKELFQKIHGLVIEIGTGTGVNLAFLPGKISYIAVEPNRAMHPYLRKNAQNKNVKLKLLACTGEHLPVKSGTVDYAITTSVLCSVQNIQSLLGEIRRVLRRKGKYLFIEHVAGKKGSIRRCIQDFVPYTPWRYFSDGCFPNRDIASEIQKAGFTKVALKKSKIKGEGIAEHISNPYIYGTASN